MTGKIRTETNSASEAVRPHSQASKSRNLPYTSSQSPLDPVTGKIPEGTIAVLAHQAFRHLIAVVENTGTKPQEITEMTVPLAGTNDFQQVKKVYAGYFPAPCPARSAFQVAALPRKADIKIEAVVSIN